METCGLLRITWGLRIHSFIPEEGELRVSDLGHTEILASYFLSTGKANISEQYFNVHFSAHSTMRNDK